MWDKLVLDLAVALRGQEVRIFVLEDDPIRIQWFREKFFGHDLTLVSSCKDVFQFKAPYDLVLLDHDLGDNTITGVMGIDYPDNGYTFVQALDAKGALDGLACPMIIHSYNATGAQRMAETLIALHKEAAYMPYRGNMFNHFLDLFLQKGEGK